jgi:hypothetical protein
LAAAGQSQPHDGGRVPSRCPLHQPLCCSPHLPPHRSAVPSPTWPAALDDKQGQPLMRSQTARLVRKGSPLHTARRYVAQHRTTKGGTVLLRVTALSSHHCCSQTPKSTSNATQLLSLSLLAWDRTHVMLVARQDVSDQPVHTQGRGASPPTQGSLALHY